MNNCFFKERLSRWRPTQRRVGCGVTGGQERTAGNNCSPLDSPALDLIGATGSSPLPARPFLTASARPHVRAGAFPSIRFPSPSTLNEQRHWQTILVLN